MRRITTLVPAALGLLALTLGTTSCKTKQVELEDFQIYDNQITAFALSTDEATLKEAVSAIPFVIRNTATGAIYNTQALPYSSADYNVHLRLAKAASNATVEVILADGTTVAWKDATQTFKSSDLLKGIQLRITTAGSGTSTNTYTYKVTFKRYQQDPHAFAWSEASVTGLPAFSSSFSGERLSSLLTYGGKLYATTSGSRLYEASALGTAFTAKTFPTTATPQTLLGGLSVDGKPTLALVGKTAAGATTFLGYNISAGTISTIGETPSTSFPTAGSTLSYELTGSSYDGAALYVSGGRTADGKASPNLWATTNGTAWLIVGGKAQAGVSAVSQSQAYVESQKRIYRFVSTASTLELYISDDRGATWQEARTVAFTGLTRTDFAGYPLVAFPSSDGETVYLLRGAKTAGESAKLFVGKFGGLKTVTE